MFKKIIVFCLLATAPFIFTGCGTDTQTPGAA